MPEGWTTEARAIAPGTLEAHTTSTDVTAAGDSGSPELISSSSHSDGDATVPAMPALTPKVWAVWVAYLEVNPTTFHLPGIALDCNGRVEDTVALRGLLYIT